MASLDEGETHFLSILEAVRKARGFDGRSYKPNYLKRRVAIRMRSTGTATYADYLRILLDNPKEMPLLVDRLTVHVTEFFRDPEVYEAVESQVLPALKASFPQETWRLWSAGSSTGEEAYSMAAMLLGWGSGIERPDFAITGTDIDPMSIGAAERGVYPSTAVEKLPEARRHRWFLSSGRRVEVAPECRRHVRFRVEDLTGSWEKEAPYYHLVFCRNLLIYLNGVQHQQLYERFSRVIRPNGFLVLGRTEAMLGAGRVHFRCVDAKNRIYLRTD